MGGGVPGPEAVSPLHHFGLLHLNKKIMPPQEGHYLLIQMNKTKVVAYFNHQGGMRSHHSYMLVHSLTVWGREKYLSLKLTYMSGILSQGCYQGAVPFTQNGNSTENVESDMDALWESYHRFTTRKNPLFYSLINQKNQWGGCTSIPMTMSSSVCIPKPGRHLSEARGWVSVTHADLPEKHWPSLPDVQAALAPMPV